MMKTWVALICLFLPATVAHAELFNGWIWNNAGTQVDVVRTSERCWDPGSFTGTVLQPNGGFWNFSTATSSSVPCLGNKYSKFVKGEITYKNGNGDKVVLAKINIGESWYNDGRETVRKCFVEVYKDKAPLNLILNNKGCLGPGDTQSFTLTINALESSDSSLSLEWGLKPNSASETEE